MEFIPQAREGVKHQSYKVFPIIQSTDKKLGEGDAKGRVGS